MKIDRLARSSRGRTRGLAPGAWLVGLGLLAAAWAGAEPAAAQTNAPNHAGFPKLVAGGGVVRFGKPLVVDLDNDNGPKEIVVGTCVNSNPGDGDCEDRRLYVFQNDGNIRAGWPRTLTAEPGSSPAAGNLDGDGTLEIVVGSGSGVPGEGNGRVTAFRADGSTLWTFSPIDTGDADLLPDPVFSTPALGDLDGDGLPDVAFGSFDFRVYALKGTTGGILPGWPAFVRDTVWSSPALADLDADGRLEVIIGADSHFEGSPINTPNGGALWVFRRNGSNFPGFPKFAPTAPEIVGFQSSPAVGDVDGDGCPEIVIGTGQSGSAAGKLLHAWNHDGTTVAGWPVALDGHPVSSPALANLDADTALEVVATDDTHFLYGLNGNGTQVFKMRPKSHTGADALAVNEPVIAQIGADNPAILVGGVDFNVTIVSKTGAQLSEDGPPFGGGKLIFATGHPVSGAAVADLDNDGGLDVIAASGSTAVNEQDLGVYVWTAGSAGALPWPQFHQGSQRQGTAPGTAGCAVPKPPLRFFTLTPCRVSDSRQPGNSTFGGPILAAGEQRTITFHGTCNIPATAKAVSLNVTVTGNNGPGTLRVFPAGDGTPTATAINWAAGRTRANNAVLGLSFDGRGQLTVQVEMAPGGVVHVITDVNGYFQ